MGPQLGQFLRAVGLEGVLVKRVAAAPTDAQVLRGLEKHRGNR